MEKPTIAFEQGPLLKGMTSSLKAGACWGLAVTWLRECYSAGPSVAGVSLTHGTTAHEALLQHAKYANQFLTGVNDDNNILNGVTMLSNGSLGGDRDSYFDSFRTNGVALSVGRGPAITTAMSVQPANYFGLLVISLIGGRHAMAVAQYRNVWAFFDPNYGTWTYPGKANGAPVQFRKLLEDNFEIYKVTEVKLFKIERLINER